MNTSDLFRVPTFLKNGIRSRAEAIAVLQQRGYQKIGYGKHAVAFAQPNAPVVVILRSTDDHGWFAFHHFVTQHPSIHYPSFGNVEHITPNLTACVVERLERNEWNEEDADNIIAQVAKHYIVYMNAQCTEKAETVLRNLAPSVANAIRSLATVVHAPIEFDLHEGNILYRENVLVFTDPFVVRQMPKISPHHPIHSFA